MPKQGGPATNAMSRDCSVAAMHKSLVLALLALPALAGCLSGDDGGSDDTTPDPATGDDFIPRVVLAIIDTGLQPYHEEFHQVRPGEDPTAHPSTYLEGYPEDAAALELTLALDDYPDPEETSPSQAHFQHDSDLWNGTASEQLYWLPGTKTVGMIAFGYGQENALPGGGHGSMTSSRSTGNSISIPGAEVLLVNVRVPLSIPVEANTDQNTPEAQAVRWAADQPWIDIQSNSWGMPFMCVGPAADPSTGWMSAFQYARDKHLVFSAAHNGHGNTGTLGYPSHCQDTAGVAGVVTVSATDNEGYASWSNWAPAIAADGCANPAVDESSINETANTGGGTSSATPYSAGGMAKVILEARRILRDPGIGVHDGVVAEAHEGAVLPDSGPLADGEFTMDEAKEVLFKTAHSPPVTDPSDGDACLNQVPARGSDDPLAWYPFIGYGEINPDTVTDAVSVLKGEMALPDRSTEDTLYTQDQELRRTLWG